MLQMTWTFFEANSVKPQEFLLFFFKILYFYIYHDSSNFTSMLILF